MKRSSPDARAGAKRAALNALRRARRAAALTGTKLSDWEGEFLGSVEERINTFGRAFADQEKGAPGDSLSALQRVKLKEITRKARAGGDAVPKDSPRARFRLRRAGPDGGRA